MTSTATSRNSEQTNEKTSISRRTFFSRLILPAMAVGIIAGSTGAIVSPAEARSSSYNKGYKQGRTVGKQHGYEDGYVGAYKASYEEAITQPRQSNNFSTAQRSGFNWEEYVRGYKAGYKKWYKIGYRSGQNDGDNDGYNDGLADRETMRDQMRNCMRNNTCG